MAHASTKTNQTDKVDISTEGDKSGANVSKKISTNTATNSFSTGPCVFSFLVVCKTCWFAADRHTELYSENEAQCNRKHEWESNKMVLEVKSDPHQKKVVIRPHKQGVREFKKCIYVDSKKGCGRRQDCGYAHHIVEQEVWQWQVKYKSWCFRLICKLSVLHFGLISFQFIT